ncbi:MAG: 4Fe-4S dicluster domain-containing protein [Geobacter sp.]|nr:MAG: 4Fe-4S dicluster domain-containing protein [Geobacter sp.]
MTPNFAIFAPLLLASLALFAFSCYRRLALVAVGKAEERFDQPLVRLKDVLLYAFGQKRVIAKPFGMNHAVIFWAFIVLLIANGEFLLSGLFPGVSLNFLPGAIHHGLFFVFDMVSLLTLACVALAAMRRLFFAPAYMETSYTSARSLEAFLILGAIALLMLAYFGLHGALIAMGSDSAGSYMPVSSLVATMLAAHPASLETLASVFWWVHALVLLAFINYLPRSKHMHILTAIPNCFFAALEKPNMQPREEFVKGESFGVGSVEQFTWKDLFDSFSCTECGRCQNACPAVATGKPLNPRQVVHDIKLNLLNAGSPEKQPLIGTVAGSTSEEAIWSCTTCGACMSACPVFIEQMPKLIKMRRHLVQMKSDFPEELLNLFENMEGRSNPWGIAPTDRTKWYSHLDVKPFEAGKTEYLLYVGCAGSFDSRQKHVTVALATILDAAGVSWGILGKEELCCGDSLRRLGNEFVFDKMAKQNVQLFREKGITKVITQCPHCFTTLKNDYRQYGLELQVIHHSELIDNLMQAGKLQLNHKVTDLGRIVFHDSCYLGRHNDIYEEPRKVIAAVTGSAPVELERHHENSFCCGAGGGRMWLEEHLGTRINLNRIEEMLTTKPDTLCVSCPYCLTMFTDGLKDLQSGNTQVRDIAEIVAEGLRPVA